MTVAASTDITAVVNRGFAAGFFNPANLMKDIINSRRNRRRNQDKALNTLKSHRVCPDYSGEQTFTGTHTEKWYRNLNEILRYYFSITVDR